jgi:hypothetical protein
VPRESIPDTLYIVSIAVVPVAIIDTVQHRSPLPARISSLFRLQVHALSSTARSMCPGSPVPETLYATAAATIATIDIAKNWPPPTAGSISLIYPRYACCSLSPSAPTEAPFRRKPHLYVFSNPAGFSRYITVLRLRLLVSFYNNKYTLWNPFRVKESRMLFCFFLVRYIFSSSIKCIIILVIITMYFTYLHALYKCF